MNTATRDLLKAIDLLRNRRRDMLKAKTALARCKFEGLRPAQYAAQEKAFNDAQAQFYLVVQQVLDAGELAKKEKPTDPPAVLYDDSHYSTACTYCGSTGMTNWPTGAMCCSNCGREQ